MKGKSDPPWTVAAAVAVAAHHWLPGQWYILLGGLAGSFAGVVARGIDPGTLLAIVLMALATYATRAGGLWLASRFDLSERAGAWLDQIPGAILVSLVAPTILMGGPVEVFAALVVVIVSLEDR